MSQSPNDPGPGFADAARRYRLDSRIATGGMGVVWRATDTRLDRSVAVKVLKSEYADDPDFRTRFETEARNAAALHHPGIAGVYDYGAGEHGTLSPYLVMELVDGQPLSALLANAKASGLVIDTAVVADLLAQAAEALGVAHRAGIVHRDVKPANLLVTPDRRVKITDFGIARALDSAALTRTGSVMGTPQYLSPEQARGDAATPASDVYALGVVAFECLTGRRPFDAETPVATALAHLQQPVPPLPASVPSGLAGVVTRALSKEPAARFTDGAALAAAFRDPTTAGGLGGAAAGAAAAAGATQVLPSMAGIPVAQPTPAAPTAATAGMRRLDSPAAYDGDDAEQRRRSPWPAAIAVILLVVGALVAAALVLGGGDDTTAADDTTDQSSSASQETSPTEETPSPTPDEPKTVEIDEDSYACTSDYRDAVDDLQQLGLRVTWQEDSQENDGSCDEGTVSRFSRNGELTEGDRVTVYYWGAVAPTPTPTPTPTPSPSNNGNGNGGASSGATDGSLLGGLGGNG